MASPRSNEQPEAAKNVPVPARNEQAIKARMLQEKAWRDKILLASRRSSPLVHRYVSDSASDDMETVDFSPDSESNRKDDEDDNSLSDIEESNGLQALTIGLVSLAILFGLILFFHTGGPYGRRSAVIYEERPVERKTSGTPRKRDDIPEPYVEPENERRRAVVYKRPTGDSGNREGPYVERTESSTRSTGMLTTSTESSVKTTAGATSQSTATKLTSTPSESHASSTGEVSTPPTEEDVTVIALPPIPRKSRPLVCVTSQQGRRATYPDDGLCDFLVFRDVTLGDGEWVSATTKGRLRPFLDRSSRSNRTVYMLSFPAKIHLEVKSFFRTTATSLHLLRRYLKRNIRGYGFALIQNDADKFAADAHHYNDIFKDIAQGMKTATTSGGTYFIGVLLRSKRSAKVENAIRRLMRVVNIFIGISHTPLPSKSPDCLVQPISSWSTEHLNDNSLQTMDAAVGMIGRVKTKNATVFALSSSMGVLRYKIHPGSNKGIEGIWNVRCTDVALEPFPNECSTRATFGSIGTGDYIVYDFNKAKNTWRSYETVDSLRVKIEKVFEELHPTHKDSLGWALYDVDLEDQKGACNLFFPTNYQGNLNTRIMWVKEFLRDKRTAR
ncbi:uncharacterized protein LOC135399678 isoform X2 [Ornithodoros turicata]|uniref:uncharacterized protein LOC135399678 isoform X2 n=1 Tax=Ornithodoros turicata TaxID=34597 RepID=UPI003138EFC5